jgi:hypothetical protein
MHLTLGLLAFLAASGLWIYCGAFSRPAQVLVLVHTLVGLAFLVPYAWYQATHLLAHLRFALEAVLLLGWVCAIALVVCVVSGLVLTGQAALGSRISYAWRQVHIVSTFVLLPVLVCHVGLVVWRLAARLRTVAGAPALADLVGTAARRATIACLVPAALAAVWLNGHRSPTYSDYRLPEDYSFKYGKNPFAPSLAVIAGNRAVHPRLLAESRSCGTAGCHEQIYREWQVSAHRWASADPTFQAVQKTMAANEGPESTRYCAGCHDPIALFSGSKNIYSADLTSYGADEGVSCVGCHSITSTDVKGNASYVLAVPHRYMYELDRRRPAKLLSDFLIRAYPQQHVASYTRDLYKTAEYCAACHKQFIDKEINKFGWVQLQNQYDNWRKSHWNHPKDPKKGIGCRECHMRLVEPSTDPAAGDPLDYNRSPGDGKHRSHRWIAANQVIPILLKDRLGLTDVDEHLRLTEEWLRGDTVIPEIQDKWPRGPTAPIAIAAPARAQAGKELEVKVTVANNKVGHDFTTGPLDVIQCWVELVALGRDRRVLFASGLLDERSFIQEGAFLFKAEGIDQHGNLIDRHNLWDMVGARYRRALFPGYSDAMTYRFTVPPDAGDRLVLNARLRYRKVNQFLFNMIVDARLADLSGARTTPITDMSFASRTLPIVSAGPAKPGQKSARPPDAGPKGPAGAFGRLPTADAGDPYRTGARCARVPLTVGMAR